MRWADLPYYRDLLAVLTSKELKLRYRGTTLGVLWSLANPIALAVVLHFAFKLVMRLAIENYALFILSALFAWQWISNSLSSSAFTFTNNTSLIRKLPFPRYMLCVAVVVGDMIHFAITIPVYALFRTASGLPPMSAEWIVGVPLLLTIQSLLILGGVMIVATMNAILRDIEQLVRVGLLLLFYLTPILYPMSMIPERLQWVVLANPLAPLILSWRALLLDGVLSPYCLLAAGYAGLSLTLGFAVYRRVSWRLAEIV
jgi:lipopolysaccharide transport system permease protein